eukprot:s857_g1.t2
MFEFPLALKLQVISGAWFQWQLNPLGELLSSASLPNADWEAVRLICPEFSRLAKGQSVWGHPCRPLVRQPSDGLAAGAAPSTAAAPAAPFTALLVKRRGSRRQRYQCCFCATQVFRRRKVVVRRPLGSGKRSSGPAMLSEGGY